MEEELTPFSKDQYDRLKAEIEATGGKVVTKWRKGLKRIKLGEIDLSDTSDNQCKATPE